MRAYGRGIGALLLALGAAALAPTGWGAAPPRETEALVEGRSITPLIDATTDSLGTGLLAWPEGDGSCYVYRNYVVVAWDVSDVGQPVAIVRKRDPSGDPLEADCSPDSLPGDFVFRNEWAEYFAGMWGDLLLIDSGTSDIRALFLIDVPQRRQVMMLEGLGETEGWIDETTIRLWKLAGTDMPRERCPEISAGFGVGVDSLYALDLRSYRLTPLGPWRCRALQ